MIIYLNGKKYDITEFINEHPGGSDVFIDGKDMTEEFDKVHHSEEAKKMLKLYLVKNEEENEEENKFKKYISKLITNHDYKHFHKILGIIVIVNWLTIVIDLIYSGSNGNLKVRKFDKYFIILLIPSLLLSISSLQFKLSDNYNVRGITMTNEWRHTNIVLLIKALTIIILLFFLIKDSIWRSLLIYGIVIIIMKYLDYYQRNNKKDINVSVIRNQLPFPIQGNKYNINKILKYFYSIIQIVSITLTFTTDFILQYLILVGLQLGAFMVTLSTKNIINHIGVQIFYLFIAIVPLICLIKSNHLIKFSLFGLIISFFRLKYRVNKYILYTIYFTLLCFCKYKISINHFSIILLLIFMIGTNNFQDKKRKKVDKIVVSNDLKNSNHHLIRMENMDTKNFKPGMYYNLYANEIKRPYTPINIKNNVTSFYIKNYKNGGTSELISNYYIKDSQIISQGPFGNKYYDKNEDKIFINNKVVKEKRILMFCCGTGITPFYSILTNLNSKTQYKFKLYCSFKKKEDSYLLNDLKSIKKKIFYSNKNKRITEKKIKKISKKYKNEMVHVLICGTSKYQEMIKSNVNKYFKKYLLTVW